MRKHYPSIKRFCVSLALIRAIGILLFLAFKIKFGQISEFTKKFYLFPESKNFSIKKGISNGRYL